MKNQIYYFTGTGNSLSIAKKLAKELKAECKHIKDTEKSISGESIGIVFPIYMFNAPHMVYEFCKKIKSCDYLYIVMTMGGKSGKTTEILETHLNVPLSAAFSIKMPDNYLVWNEAQPEDQQRKLFDIADERISEIVEMVKGRKEHRDDEKNLAGATKAPFIFRVIPASWIQAFGNMGFKRIKSMDKAFVVNDDCSNCQACVKLCPSKNITMVDKKPVWHNNCEQCFGCIQWCPEKAIDYKKKTVGKKRYHHPDIKLKEMFE